MTALLQLTRDQIMAFRRRVGALDQRLPPGAEALRHAAWAGLQDSMPRAALLSIHARVQDTSPSTWEDPSLAQVWGPRFSVYVVPAQDHAIFTLGRYPDDARGRRVAEDTATRIHDFLRGRRMSDKEVGRGLGVNHNSLRYATTTGTVLIRWEGARAPTIWVVPRPDIAPFDARLELARRYLRVYGPTTASAFATWAGIGPGQALAAFEALRGSLTETQTPIGQGWILSSDEPNFRLPPQPAAPASFLPSGDAFYLLQGRDRELLIPDATRRLELWTSRVWPGALLVNGEIAGTWRRAHANVAIQTWREFSAAERRAVEAEAATLPLPGIDGHIRVAWS